MADRIVAYYEGTGTDSAGRLIHEVWAYDFDDLEWHHDYIQWLFPLPQPSQFNPDAPLLTPDVAGVFHRSPVLRARVLRSLDVMLTFYGLERVEGATRPGPGFAERVDEWAWPDDHNHLRLSRMIQSLNHLGLPAEARQLQAVLLVVSEQLGPHRITRGTASHWHGLSLPLNEPEWPSRPPETR